MDIVLLDGFQKIYAVDCFEKEFQHLFDSASLKRYTNWLWRNLRNLDRYGKKAVDGTHIEKLRHDKHDFYSIRSANSKSNPRVVFIFATQDDAVILLCAMLEKSSEDYRKGLRRANGRFQELEE